MTTIPQKIASMIDLNVPETHLDVDLEQPKRKENNPFPADKIRSSLSRNMSFKSTAEVAPKLERIVPKVEGNLAEVAVPKAEVKPEPNTDMTTAKSQIKTLLKENDCLLLENEKQQEEMQELEMKISSLSRQLLTVNQELKESQDQQILIQDQLFQFKNSSKDMERILQKEAHVVASKDADIEQLSELLRKRQYEIKQNLDKQEQLKKALSDLSERYKEIVRESSYATQREKQLLKEVEEKDQVIDQLKELMEEKKKSYILIEEESEKLKAINKGLERKVQLLERKELEYISKNQQQSHDLEEALFERDVATKREQSLLKEIETLTQQCLDQPRIYSEKHTLAMQTLQSQFNVERRTFCDEVGKLEVLVASLQSQIDRAIREKRAAESELDKITAHLPAETNRLEMALEEAHSKLRQSERDKHEAIQKLDSVYNKLQKEQHQYDAERRQANDRMEESYRRVRRMEIQVNESKEKEIQLTTQVSSLEHDRKVANETIKSLKHQHESQINLTTQKYEAHVHELTTKLENLSESHSGVHRDMQKLLSTQRVMSEKWKEESQVIKDHYEQILVKTKFELQQYQNRLGESECIIKKLSAQKRELNDQMGIEKRHFGELHERFMNLESQNATLKRQVSQLIAKEVEIIEEKKNVCRQLDRLLIEREQKSEKRQTRPRIRSALEELENQPLKSVFCID